MKDRIVVDLTGAKASNGEALRGLASFDSVGEAARMAAATGGKVVLPPGMNGNVADAMMQAYGLQKLSHRVYTFCV
jgi:hypothetical protein